MGAGRLLPWMNAVGIRYNWQPAEAEEPRPSGTLLRGLGAAAAARSRCPWDQWPYPKKSHGDIERAAAASGTRFPRSLRTWTRGSPKGGGDSDTAGRGAEVPGVPGESTQSEVR
jgi:hypothetical protein